MQHEKLEHIHYYRVAHLLLKIRGREQKHFSFLYFSIWHKLVICITSFRMKI